MPGLLVLLAMDFPHPEHAVWAVSERRPAWARGPSLPPTRRPAALIAGRDPLSVSGAARPPLPFLQIVAVVMKPVFNQPRLG